MKLTTTHDIEGNLAPIETASFRIENSGKGFRILVDGLYSNKIRAVVREISTNAYDAHLAAGRPDARFHVDLPTLFDLTFRVRDYGTSMTHDEVMGLYTTIFASSKDETNEFVGALGLGSKSPYAYTDAFTVTAWLDGEERQYIMSMDKAGTPTVSLMATVKSDKPDGIQVEVPVASEDMHRFEREAYSVLKAFDPQPTVNDGFELPSLSPIHTFGGGEAMIFHDELSEGTLQVKQGCVIYPVTDSSLTNSLHIEGFRLGGYGSDSKSLLLDVPIGSVEIAANREALSITPETREYLEGAITRAADEARESFDEMFDACPTRLAAAELLINTNAASWWSGSPRYRGQALNTMVNLSATNAKYAVSDDKVASGRRKNSKEITTLNHFDIRNRDRYTFVMMNSNESVVRVSARYKAFIDTLPYYDQDYVYFCKDMTPRHIERMMRLVGFKREQFRSVVSLPDPGPRDRASNGQAVLQGVRALNGGVIDCAADMPDDYYWVTMKRPTSYEFSALRTSYRKLVDQLGGENIPMLVMTPSAAKRFKPEEGREIDAALTAKALELEEDLVKAYHDSHLHRNFHGVALSDEQKEAMGVPSKVDPFHVELAGSYVDHDVLREAAEQASAKLEEIKEMFPLLLDRSDGDAVQWYIEARIAATEAATDNESEGN